MMVQDVFYLRLVGSIIELRGGVSEEAGCFGCSGSSNLETGTTNGGRSGGRGFI